SVLQIGSMQTFFESMQTEGEQFTYYLVTQIPGTLIIITQNCNILCGLEFEDARLRSCIGFHRTVTIEMVRRNIQDRGNIWRDRHLVQLKGGKLKDGDIIGFHPVNIVDQRVTDITADICL